MARALHPGIGLFLRWHRKLILFSSNYIHTHVVFFKIHLYFLYAQRSAGVFLFTTLAYSQKEFLKTALHTDQPSVTYAFVYMYGCMHALS